MIVCGYYFEIYYVNHDVLVWVLRLVSSVHLIRQYKSAIHSDRNMLEKQ